jgi:hypothetical protein
VPFGLKINPLPHRNTILADLHAAESSRKGAVVEGTHAKFNLAWKRFKSYLISIGINGDWYLDNFSKDKKHKILGAFCNAIREGRLHSRAVRTNKSESVRAALDNISQALLSWQTGLIPASMEMGNLLSFYKDNFGDQAADPAEKRQIAISGSVLREFYRLSRSAMDKARCELFIGTFFFAMRSCEYLSVQGKRKTKLLCIRNIRFFQGKRLVKHSDPLLYLVSSVSITFEEHKCGSKGNTITHHRTKDPVLCPVKIWTKVVSRILSYESSGPDTSVNVFRLDNGNFHKFSGKDLLMHLHRVAASLGSDNLGYTPDQIGLHSACSGAAMAMYLAGVPVFTIMLLGHWSSDAFLRYIRKEVQEFSLSVSSKMITRDKFFTLSQSQPNPSVSQGALCNNATRSNFGPNFKDALTPLIRSFGRL